MKYNGEAVNARNVQTLVLPREGGDPFIFTAESVLDFEQFEKLCPEPQVPAVIKPGKGKEENPQDPGYLAQVTQREQRRIDWMVIQSLKATKEIEWEKVKDDDYTTWDQWSVELKEAGFAQMEINRVHMLCLNVNSLNEALLERARKDFLAGQEETSEK